MIAKISKGGSFRGALNYVLGKGRAELIGGNMAGETARELSSEYGRIRQIKGDIEKPVYHVSLALPEGESFTPEQWQTVASDYLSQVGMDPSTHQYIVAQHHDTTHQHVHIIANRISLDGKLFNVFRDQIKSRDVCRRLEAKYGLTEVSSEKKTYRAKTTQRERQMNKRTGRDSEKIFVQEKLNAIFADGEKLTPQELSMELEDNGIVMIPNVARTGKVNGFSFQYAGRSYTGSQVGYAWKYLEPHLTMDEFSVQWMQERKMRLQEGTPADAVRSLRNAVWEVGIQGVPFARALEKQGWTLDGDRLKKGSVDYSISSVLDADELRENLRVLESLSGETKERAREKSRELARLYHGVPRRSFLAEMKTEDVICGMMMFPQVAAFLVVLSVLTEVMRNIERPQTEAEFKEKLRAIWSNSNTAVHAEIRRVQEGIRNAAARPAGGNQTDKSITEKTRPGLRDADGSRESGMFQVGKIPDSTTPRIEGSHTGDERNREPIAVETTDTHSNDDSRIRRGSSSAPAGSLDAGDKSRDGATTPPFWGAVEEWASLAQDLNTLTRGDEDMAKKEKSASVLYREQVWDRQHSALQAPSYRVTVRGRGVEDGKTINLCKQKDGTEVTWTADEVKRRIPSLEYWNARGFDITPMDDDFHHILIDDLTAVGVEHLRSAGFSPCLVQVSSDNNFQAILRVPKAETSPEEQSAANALLQKLNSLPPGCGGDRAISAPRHPFRMTGFNNKKPSRHNVQTKIELIEPGAVCSKASAEMDAIREARAADRRRKTEERNRVETRTRRSAIETVRDRTIQRPDGETSADKDFRCRWNKWHGLAKVNVREGIWENVDDSVIDFRVCKEMISGGYDEESVATALQRCSPGLFDRHRNPDDYVRRTVEAAMEAIIRETPESEPEIGR